MSGIIELALSISSIFNGICLASLGLGQLRYCLRSYRKNVAVQDGRHLKQEIELEEPEEVQEQVPDQIDLGLDESVGVAAGSGRHIDIHVSNPRGNDSPLE